MVTRQHTQESSFNKEKSESSDPVINEVPLDGEDLAVDTAKAATQGQYSEEEFTRLLRKVDRYLLPLMWVCYGVQQADKTGLSTQATFGIKTDTHLVGQQYSWLSTIFYITYLLCEFPANWMMQRVNIGKTLAFLIFIWGVIVLCTAFAKDWADLMALRALQGAAECTISPAFVIIIASWYTRREHTMRFLIWASANAGFAIINDLCMYGIGRHAQSHGGLAAWKGISFFLGGITIVLSFFVFFLLGTPREVMWLSADEKRMAAARIAVDQTGSDRQKKAWKKYQAWEALADPQTWFIFVIVIVSALPNGGLTTFGNLVYVSFGFSNLDTLLEGTIPRNALSVIWFLSIGWLSLKRKNIRFWIMMASTVPLFVGLLGVGLLPAESKYLWSKWGLYLMSVTGNINGLLIWTFVASNVAGRTKKSVVSTIMFIGYCVGNAIGAQMFQAKDAPRYVPALIACAVLAFVQFWMLLAWRTYYVLQNKKRERVAEKEGITEEQRVQLGAINGEQDMTDLENPQ
ncbi:MFS general substrate transporter [Stereum hirsutum FP-91666 SS1]|uniref:MFS general substrate transporter n=1 Tax=Stereum hirsutum (strain FP-91666) TaxID=721885 RepID=UPI0004449710|nr:MFS general substrate transporter [Stereum hirsutum FP-91666 SS1]EIM84644.1 MFS general substrate transporter [Stereum hirsutum FP-91666 SS1]